MVGSEERRADVELVVVAVAVEVVATATEVVATATEVVEATGGGGDGGGRGGGRWRWGWCREWGLQWWQWRWWRQQRRWWRQRQRWWRQRQRWWRWRWRWCWSRCSRAARRLGWSGGAGPCTYVLRTGSRRGETCELPHTAQRCFGRLTDAWRAQFPDAVELPRWHDLLLQNVAIFVLDFDAILAAMSALTNSVEGDYYLSVPPDPGIEAAALSASECAAPGAGESALSGTAPTNFGASRSFFRDSTTLTPLSRPVAVSLADLSRGPVLAHSSTVLSCPAAPSGLLSGLHFPSFSTNLVSGADLRDAWVDQFTPGGQHVTHCTCSRTGRHLATFTHRLGSSPYTLTTASPPVSTSGQVASSSQVFAAASRSSPASAPYSYHPVARESPLAPPPWSPLPASSSRNGLPYPCLGSTPVPPCPSSGACPYLSRVRGQGHERYFLLVVDDYSRYTTVFPLRSKGEVPEVVIDWIRGARRQLSKRFGSNLPVLRLHSDRGGEFSSDLPRAFCRAEGIRQTFTLPASPQQNGIADHRIGMVMDVAHTSMIHAAAPHFLWPFAVQYAAHQINLQPRVSLPETTPTLSVFLGFPPDPPGWQFYHPTSHRVLSSKDFTFDESVSYYRLFPYRTASLPPLL
ncbi:unnamed protein product [Closterium sp. NIES-54]